MIEILKIKDDGHKPCYLIQKGNASKCLPDLRGHAPVLEVDGLGQHQVQDGHQVPALVSVNLGQVDLTIIV